MTTLMLISHVIVASVMTLLTLLTIMGTLRSSISFAAKLLVPSLGMTAGTGVALALAAPMTFGRFCITMSIATAGVMAVKYYYEKRLQNSL